MELPMGLFDLFPSSRATAMSLYKRGMQTAHKRDREGAIADYTALIELADAPPDLTAMARFNRAVAYSSMKDYQRANDELNAVVAQ